MLNIQKSKNTVSIISNIPIIYFLKFAYYTKEVGLMGSRDIEAVLQEAEAKSHEAEAEAYRPGFLASRPSLEASHPC